MPKICSILYGFNYYAFHGMKYLKEGFNKFLEYFLVLSEKQNKKYTLERFLEIRIWIAM